MSLVPKTGTCETILPGSCRSGEESSSGEERKRRRGKRVGPSVGKSDGRERNKGAAAVEELGNAEGDTRGMLMKVVGRIGGVKGVFMLDTGATTQFISAKFAAAAGLAVHKSRTKIRLADRSVVAAAGRTGTEMFTLQCEDGGVASYACEFEITEAMSYDAILGMSWFEQAKPQFVWEHGRSGAGLEVMQRNRNGRKVKRVLETSAVQREQLVANITVVRDQQQQQQNKQKEEEKEEEPMPRTPQEEEVYQRLTREFADVFPSELPDGLPPRREGVEHEIKLKPHVKPPYRRPYKCGPNELELTQKSIEELSKKQFIQRSQSRYGAPVLFTPKKDGTMRMVVDYREINKITVKNGYPLPAVEELFPIVEGAKYFSKIDLHSGYYQIRIAEQDREKTAFVTRYGSYEFLVLPMGLCNSPGTFMEMMNRVFEKHLDRFVVVFLDDVLVFSKTIEEHERHLREVLGILRAEKLYAKMSKCELVRGEVDFLGHRLGRDGLGRETGKTKQIVEWPQPTNKTQLQQFLGLANYYRKFVKDFSKIAAPLNKLTGGGVKYQWTEKEQQSFVQLKRALSSAPVLALPRMDLPFVINSDASIEAVGAVLQQDQGHGLQPVAYYSATMNDAERHYPTHEQEMLAMVKALRNWRHLLVGHRVHAKSDHQSLQDFFNQDTLSRRQVRWMEELADYDLEISYVKGAKNTVADALSRKDGAAVRETPTFKSLGWTISLNSIKELAAVRRTRRVRPPARTAAEEEEERQRCIRAAEVNTDVAPDRPDAGATGAIVMPTQQCTAFNRKGKRCRARTAKGQYCWVHLQQKEGTRIKKSTLGRAAGNGLFAAKEFQIGDKIALYTGDWVYDEDEVWGGNYLLYWNAEKSIDAARTNAAPGRFANDARGTGKRSNATISYDRRNGNAVLRATRKIKKGDEIFVPYGQGYWSEHGVVAREAEDDEDEEKKEEAVDLTAVTQLDVKAELQKECVIDEEYHQRRQELQEAEEKKEDTGEWTVVEGLILRKGIIQVPATQRARTLVVDQCHDDPAAGHLGRDKTVDRIKLRFYWEGLDEWVADYVKSCVQCQKAKGSNQRMPGELMPMPIPARPWAHMCIDFMGPFRKTKSGKDGIAVMVDPFSKMGHLAAITMTITAPEVGRVVDREVVRLHGIPEVIIHDRDVRFTATYWQNLWKERGTEVRFSTAYHPQTDGQTERMNRTVIQIMRTMVEEYGDEWDECLPMVEMAMNSAKQSSTGMSPYQMVFGREMTLPVDTRLGTGLVSTNPAVGDLGTRLREVWDTARKQIEKSQQRQKRNADESRRKEEFKVGDQVMLSTEELRLIGSKELMRSVKFLPKYIGPFRVISVRNRNAYKLELPPKFEIHPTVNISRLKRYVDGEQQFPDRVVVDFKPPADRIGHANGEEEWEVEAILGERGTGARKRYLVKWKGWPMWESTWEPRANLTNVDELLKQYADSMKQKEGGRDG